MKLADDDSTATFGLIALILGLAAMGVASMELISPSYSDQELANYVDSWALSVAFGQVLLVVFGAALLFCLIAAVVSHALTRKLFKASLASFGLAICLQVASLNVLTTRTENVVGHGLHWLPQSLR